MCSSFTPINSQSTESIPATSTRGVTLPSTNTCIEAGLKRRRTFLAHYLGKRGDTRIGPALEQLHVSSASADDDDGEGKERSVKRRSKRIRKNANGNGVSVQPTVAQVLKARKPRSNPRTKSEDSREDQCTIGDSLEFERCTERARVDELADSAACHADAGVGEASDPIRTDKISLITPMTSQIALKDRQKHGYTVYEAQDAQAIESDTGPKTSIRRHRSPAGTASQPLYDSSPVRIDQGVKHQHDSILQRPLPANARGAEETQSFDDLDYLSESDLVPILNESCQTSLASAERVLSEQEMSLETCPGVPPIDGPYSLATVPNDEEAELPSAYEDDNPYDLDTDFESIDEDDFFELDLEQFNNHVQHPSPAADQLSLSTPPISSISDPKSSSTDVSMPPIVRPPFPKPCRDRSPIIGLSTDTLLRTCFRVGEAINESRRAMRLKRQFILELYARMLSSSAVTSGSQKIVLCDLFHDHPPLLNSTYAVSKGKEVWRFDNGEPSTQINGNKKLCRCVGKMRLCEGNRLEFEIFNIWEAEEADIEYVKEIYCATH